MAIQKTKNSTFFHTISSALEAQSKSLFLIFSFCIALILAFFAHKVWVTHREKSVQYDFSILLEEYETKIQEKDPEWTDLLQKFETSLLQIPDHKGRHM